MEDLEKINEIHREKWFEASNMWPSSLEKITLGEKRKREKELDGFIDGLVKLLKDFPKGEKEREAWRDNFTLEQERLLEKDDFLNMKISDREMKKGILNITKRFVKEAKDFDETMELADIGQALRNVWIITILQGVFGKEVEYSTGIFGYSMLYPFTDNFLDDIKISIREKKNFNERFTTRLKGEKIHPLNSHEEKVYRLVEKIEEKFSRGDFPKVYESLLEIQKGQMKSISIQEGKSIPYEKDILRASIEKGGASVIVDGYLIYGDMSYEELFFSVGYGVLLQLGDDLQDVKEDIKNGHDTIFSQLAGKYNLEPLVNKLLNFTNSLIDSSKCFNENKGEELRELIKDNCLLLILFSVVLSKEYFSKEYINEVEEYLPFTIKYVENLQGNLKKKMRGLKGVLNNSKELLENMINT